MIDGFAAWSGRILAVGAVLATVGGCSPAKVIDGDANGVWIREAMIGSGDPAEVAAEYCAQWGKKAVYEHTLRLRDHMEIRPTWVYACR
jgi:hypothetical protein